MHPALVEALCTGPEMESGKENVGNILGLGAHRSRGLTVSLQLRFFPRPNSAESAS